MRLRVLQPASVAIDEPVSRVRAEAPPPVGSFTLLPRHVDSVTTLAQGLLSYSSEGAAETWLAVDGGTLVKVGDEIVVSTPKVVKGASPDELLEAIRGRFGRDEERDRRAHVALEHVGASIVERLVELEELGRHG